ncbi:MAG: LysR family transcriptional regulator [Pseudohongiellaceae bacterium]
MNKKDKTRQPSIRQLEYFVNIAMSSNYRKAAQKLNISQPTLTGQISTLEDALGVKLFERSRAGTLLSPEGRELLPMVRQLLEQFQQVIDQADNRNRELSGTFKIGVSPTIGPYLFSRVLIELHERYPHLQLHVREGVPQELEQGLDNGDYDFILTMLPMHSSDNRVRALFVEPISVVLSKDHPLAAKELLEGKDLYNQDVLTMDERHHLHRQIATLCERFTAHAQRKFTSNSLNTLKQMAIMNMGIAFMPGLYIHARITEGDQLKVLNLRDEKINRTHVASWRKNAPSRHLFQKISYDIKTIAMDIFQDILEEVNTEDV